MGEFGHVRLAFLGVVRVRIPVARRIKLVTKVGDVAKVKWGTSFAQLGFIFRIFGVKFWVSPRTQ
jgi:hypothetical protein